MSGTIRTGHEASSCFAEVLTREARILGGVADIDALTAWRVRLVDELRTPHSYYAQALQPALDGRERAAFLESWRELIADALARVHDADTTAPAPGDRMPPAEVDAQRTAVLILAAVHGGSILSRVARDPAALDAALDLALASSTRPSGGRGVHEGSRATQNSMDS